ncbi:putative indole-3-acetic acid-amido synthetase GH3.5 [Heracleum sosnowskyi]|uniref:Indole-3-acetic acid-amido synthetase GH3.5 n=1 Tax=Heracleum sosnowskyi TaxID=360622 RepID=A0AAD8JKF2_9APIA|nr:putative indole-3-acetic acid-amido synthetase GH3.5 [Heracleum sosnowskyi]
MEIHNADISKIMDGGFDGDDGEVIDWFDVVAENAGRVQTETLCRILKLNYGVEYLRKWLGDIDVEDMDGCALETLFTSLVPLATHADLECYLQRIADGDKSPLLTQQPITTLSLSSGTTDGRQKYIPFTRHSSRTTLQIFRLAAAYRSRVYPIKEGGRILEFIYSSKQKQTEGGLKSGTATTHYFASKEFKTKQEKTKCYTCSPEAVISSGDYKQSTYCHLLLGLFFSNRVEFIASTFAYSIVQAFTSLEEHWRDLCNDIKYGNVNSTIITIPKTRKSVLDIISPNPFLASRIEAICEELEQVGWYGLIPKLWPNAKYVYSIMTGSMQTYHKKLLHFARDLPLVSADYGSTESWIGVNIDPSAAPENVTFAVIPTFSYYEFIPLHRNNPDDSCNTLATENGYKEDEPVPLSRVKAGQQYEIVLTTFTGLYRYRLGDVVEVAGFHKGTPKLNFVCRRKLILTINIDKNTEKDLQLVVDKGAQLLMRKAKAEVVDFTSHANLEIQPGHYVIYWEIKGDVDRSVFEECCREMDVSFVDHGYVVSRRTNSIGPLELCILERGTFTKILEHFIGNGGALSQFKTPRCTSDRGLLTILNACTTQKFYSPKYGSQ